jgi:hypothetical protein
MLVYPAINTVIEAAEDFDLHHTSNFTLKKSTFNCRISTAAAQF